ncbi:hypothetical protein ACHAXT_005724 [Thalassiosira profunda]
MGDPERREARDGSASTTDSWLREDCLEFYRKELLLLDDGDASNQRSKKTRPAIQIRDRVGLLRVGIDKSMVLKRRFPNAQFLEFGVHEGKDLLRMATYLRSVEETDRSRGISGGGKDKPPDNLPYTTFHGFDSFEGLPEDWINGQVGEDDLPLHSKGAFCTGGKAPDLDDTCDIKFHKGWFHESLPSFLSEGEHGSAPVAFVHADADLYSSTLTFLELLCEKKLLRKGSVLVFDEYWNYPGWENGEYRAWNEIAGRFGLRYEYLCYHAPHSTKKHKHYGYQSVGVLVTNNPGR